MNWIKENKFLAGLLVVLVLGVGAIGYLLMGARGKLATATEEYETLTRERSRLHNLVPYPSPENVKELQAQKADASAKISELHRALAGTELPVEPLTPVQFQDKLRTAVTEVKTLAGTQTDLPDKFFLAFERYETTTPDTAAAAPLGRELKAMQWLVTRFIEAKVAAIKELQRDPLPEEGGKAKDAKAAAAPSAKSGAKGDKAEPAGPPLVQPHGIDIVVIGDQSALRNVLNDIVGSKEQFYIPRRVSFKNEQEKAPTRSASAPPAPAAPADGAAPADPAAPVAVPTEPTPGRKAASQYIVGLEKVEMALRLELVDFAAVAANPPAK